MPCDTQYVARKLTFHERIAEIQQAITKLDRAIIRRQIKPVVGPQGAITFAGWQADDKVGITDACAYRRLMVSGSALAKAEIARAEQRAGRGVDRKVLSTGIHSHDGGMSWNEKG